MTPQEMEARIVRHADLKPCKSAFIDAHTPGSDRKDNFAIVGGGVSESADQHVHIRETPGFNIGAAGQPPGCRNSLHSHRTAEVFFVLSGRWRFFWGLHGDAGEVTLDEGDVFDIPTGMFRGFENVGAHYGMLMAILGGDDAGGGVIWAPHVIEEAKAHGLVLGENGTLYDTGKGESLPAGVHPMPVLGPEALAAYAEPPASEVVAACVARYADMVARTAAGPVQVIGESALIVDRPGFTLEFLTPASLGNAPYSTRRNEVLLVVRGRWQLRWAGGETALGPGDTCVLPPGLDRGLASSEPGDAGLFRVRDTDDPAGPSQH